MTTETAAIIDLGTNTFHLMIAEINERDEFVIREKFKEPVKLGEGGINSGKIAKKAFGRGIQALKKFQEIIASKGVGPVFAFATSAIRSASNGKEFILRAKEETQIEIKIINGNEEASLIFEGVRGGIKLPSEEDTLIVDIGGGSVEFIVTHDNKAQLFRSVNIGAARLLETVNPSDPISKKELLKTNSILAAELDGLINELKEFEITTMVGSSGTFETLASLIAYDRGDLLSAENLNGYTFTTAHFNKIHKNLTKETRTERLALQGMDPMRVDMIIFGSIIVDYVLSKLKTKNIIISLFALKEGILLRYILDRKERVRKLLGKIDVDLRVKSIRNLGKKYQCDLEHGMKVGELSVSIFDQLKSLHGFRKKDRELLKYAALLHDIGYFINRSSHHKHGQYILMNSGLSGFSNDELVIIGNIIRYHRKAFPSREHFHFKILDEPTRYLIRVLASILRIADHLDRGHRNLVKEVNIILSDDQIMIFALADKAIDIEVAEAIQNTGMMEQVFERQVSIEQTEVHTPK